MAALIYFENFLVSNCIECTNVSDIKNVVSSQYGVPTEDLYVLINGKRASDESHVLNNENVVRVFTKLSGGKGGFGSMLRAIGAQIEKTTNREACRDLSGRRLRDINEEKRLRKWLEGQDDREREAIERKQKKLERLIAEPKIKVDLNPTYVKECAELPERVSAAVDAGWQAAGSSKEGLKRKSDECDNKNKKKAKLWIDADWSDCSSLSEDEEEECKSSAARNVSTDSGNESDRISESSNSVGERKLWCILFLLSLLTLVTSRPQNDYDDDSDDNADDRKDDVGRVQIKVYRGPTKHDGYAPWGFWVKQPSDEK